MKKVRMQKLIGKNEDRQMFPYCEPIRTKERSSPSKCKDLNQYFRASSSCYAELIFKLRKQELHNIAI